MKKQKKSSYHNFFIIMISIAIVILCAIIFIQIVEITPDEDPILKEETNDYDTEHKYDEMYFQTYSKDEVLEAYQTAKNKIDVNQLESVSEHIELISIMVIKTMNMKPDEINSINEETQVAILNLAILGYQVRGIGLEPLKLLFNGKYQSLVEQAMENGFIYPSVVPETESTEIK